MYYLELQPRRQCIAIRIDRLTEAEQGADFRKFGAA
jgi:hypothetical protein